MRFQTHFSCKIGTKKCSRTRKALNRNLLLKIGQFADLDTSWWGLISQVLIMYREDLQEKLHILSML